jgi:ABC-type glycerol-3-phosphate transport system permease component
MTAGNVFWLLGLGFLLVVSLAPLAWMFLQSIMSDEDQLLARYPWQIHPTLASYGDVLNSSDFYQWGANSLIVLVGTLVLVVVTSYLAGYGLAYFPVPGRRLVARLLLASYVVPQTLVFLPLYILIERANLDNNLFSLIVTYPMLAIPFVSWLFLSYFRGLPAQVAEAASVDGASRFAVFTRLLLPMSFPVVVAAIVFTIGVAASEILFASVFLPNSSHQTIAAGLAVTTVDPDEVGGVVAAALLAALPLILLCIAFARQYVQGLTAAMLEGA